MKFSTKSRYALRLMAIDADDGFDVPRTGYIGVETCIPERSFPKSVGL